MSFSFNGNNSRESDQVRARKLPADFGEDDPEVIALRQLQAAAKAERDKASQALETFRGQQLSRNQAKWAAEAEIQRIDDGRPRLLARLILDGGDFTEDANQQRKRRELALLVERHTLATQGMTALIKELDDQAREANRRYTNASNTVSNLLDKLRLQRVAAQN